MLYFFNVFITLFKAINIAHFVTLDYNIECYESENGVNIDAMHMYHIHVGKQWTRLLEK